MASQEYLQEYVEEVKEHLQELESSLLILEREGNNKEGIGQIFRAAHSIKGASAYMGFERLAGLTHELESLISKIQTHSRPVTAQGISVLLECVDFISVALKHLQANGEEPALPSSLLQELLSAFSISESGRAEDGSGTVANEHGPPRETDSEVPPLNVVHEPHSGGTETQEHEPTLFEPYGGEDPQLQEEEEDQELLSIFLDCFKENFTELASVLMSASSKDVGIREADFKQACHLFERLITSSQYMDYDHIVGVLRELEKSFMEARQRGALDGRLSAELFGEYAQQLQSLLPGLQIEFHAAASEQVLEVELVEEDEELFTIFLDSFRQYFAELLQLGHARPEASFSPADLERARELIKRLINSSQYMDYAHVVSTLGDWEDSLTQAFQSDTADAHLYTDLLCTYGERLKLLLPALQLQLPSALQQQDCTAEEVVEEEDQELLGIFLDSFRQYFAELSGLVPEQPEALLSDAHVERAHELIKRLLSSSQYMGYSRILDLLGEWETTLMEAAQSGSVGGKFYSDLLHLYGERLQKMLPGLQTLMPPPGTATEMDAFDFEIDATFDAMQKADVAVAVPSDDATNVEQPATEGKQTTTSQLQEAKTAKRAKASAISEEAASAHTLRVDAQKVDRLLNQVGELVVTRSEFVQTGLSFRELLREFSAQGKLSKSDLRKLRTLGFRLNESTLSLGRVANDLQDSVMRIRMLPIAHLFQRFPRVVRDQALKLGKRIELIIEGGDTEIDKRVLEQMHDPLVQFLRNAIAHGIESPEERRKAGKSETGTIRLAAYHEGDYVALEISDDGRGIDTHKLRRLLQRRKEMAAHELERLSNQEILHAIFLPGISTHDRVDGTAGRGVGLDVVKENVERMNGTIEVESPAGLGTRFIIKIPLTVAIIRALLVRGAGQVFTLPLSSVSEILRYEFEKTHSIEGFEVTSLRGKTIPLVHLSRLLNMPGDHSKNDHKFIVIVATSFREVGLVVDGLMGEREVVIKSIEDECHAFEGFSGATVLGDGTVSLILDVSAMLKMMKGVLSEHPGTYGPYLH